MVQRNVEEKKPTYHLFILFPYLINTIFVRSQLILPVRMATPASLNRFTTWTHIAPINIYEPSVLWVRSVKITILTRCFPRSASVLGSLPPSLFLMSFPLILILRILSVLVSCTSRLLLFVKFFQRNFLLLVFVVSVHLTLKACFHFQATANRILV